MTDSINELLNHYSGLLRHNLYEPKKEKLEEVLKKLDTPRYVIDRIKDL